MGQQNLVKKRKHDNLFLQVKRLKTEKSKRNYTPMYWNEIADQQKEWLTAFPNTLDWSFKKIRRFLTIKISSLNHFQSMYYAESKKFENKISELEIKLSKAKFEIHELKCKYDKNYKKEIKSFFDLPF